MEQFGARPGTPLETCISEVEQCDIYVGIIAFKLGSINPESGKSYTQLEYERALELNKEILIYLMDETTGEITPDKMDKGQDRDRLDSFRATLKERHTVDFFTNENDLAEKLDRKFSQLLTKTKQDKEVAKDEFEKSKEVINLFLLLPRAYSNKEVRMTLSKTGHPFSASKSVCECFNLEFGKTMVQPVKVIKPDIKGEQFKYLFVDYKLAEFILSFQENSEFDCYVKLLFTERIIGEIRANFQTTYITKKVENPDYNPILPERPGLNLAAYTSIGALFAGNPKYISINERIEGDGKIVMLLKEIVH